MLGSSQPIYVLSQGAEREQGRNTQAANIQAAAAVSSIVKTTLGPRSMLKLVIDPMGGVVITNDGNAILREIDVTHPAAKSIIELSRSMDEEVGDGTTSVVIVTDAILSASYYPLMKQIHPTQLVKGYFKALSFCLNMLQDICTPVDVNDTEELERIVRTSMGTKFSAQWGAKISQIAVKAAKIVSVNLGDRCEIDIKRFARIEKLPGGCIDDCMIVNGIAIEKDVTHSRMRRKIVNPRIILLDCPLEYKKGESMTNVEITNEDEFEKLLLQEEEEIRKMTDSIASIGCDLVITEKGVSDLAAHFLMKNNISIVRRAKKTEQNRLARITGAKIVNRCDELSLEDVGTGCGLFEVRKIDDDYWTFLTDCVDPKACTILLRGGSKDSLNEIERNLHDALSVARNILLDPKLAPGGGASEIALSLRLLEYAKQIGGLEQWGCRAVAEALEAIPRVLVTNSGADVISTMAALKTANATKGCNQGIDGVTGQIVDTIEAGILDTYTVKSQILKTAIECSAMLIRVDDILSGIGKPAAAAPVMQ